MQQYFLEIERKTRILYDIAGAARARGLDPNSIVEIPLAMSLAERVTGLVSVKYPQTLNSGIEKRIRELEKEFGSLDFAVAIKIAEETALEKFCKFRDQLEAIDAGIRIGLAYLTLGVISSPLEGFTQLALKKTAKGEDYFAIYYFGNLLFVYFVLLDLGLFGLKKRGVNVSLVLQSGYFKRYYNLSIFAYDHRKRIFLANSF